jgi:hypothetical protein
MKKKHLQCWLSIFLILLLLSLAGSVGAQSAPVLTMDPEELDLRVISGHGSAVMTFYVIPNQEGLTEVTFLARPLTETTGKNVDFTNIPANQIAFEPNTLTTLTPGKRLPVTITINNVTGFGVWEGQVIVQYQGEDNEAAVQGEMTVPFTLTIATVPVLAIKSADSVTVAGNRAQTDLQRQVVLEETSGGGVVEELSLIPINPKGDQDFPDDLLMTALSADQVRAGGTVDLDLTFDLSQARSGSYENTLYIKSKNAAEVSVPVTITIKDPPFWPLFVMLVAVIVGSLLTYYRTRMMEKDKILSRIVDLKTCLENDQTFNRYCGIQKVRPLIRQAKDHLREGKPGEAGTRLTEAESLWETWADYRGYLVKRINEIITLLDSIKAMPEAFKAMPSVDGLAQTLKETLDKKIPDYVAAPETLHDKTHDPKKGWQPIFEALKDSFQNLVNIKTALDKAEAAGKLGAEALKGFRNQRTSLLTALGALQAPLDVTKLADVEPQITALHDAVERALADRWTGEDRERIDLMALETGEKGAVPNRKAKKEKHRHYPWQAIWWTAKRRLALFSFVTYLISLGLVVYGFRTLYTGVDTFGVNGWWDYISLVVWGLGAPAGQAEILTYVKERQFPTDISA